jgi:hypothetical protein
MNRISLDAAYEYRWRAGKISPFVKVGGGSMVILSGRASGAPHPLVGADSRLQEIAGAGFNYPLSRRFSLLAEYDCRFFRNPDFTDHHWHPERNEVSEPKFGFTYTFGRE